MSCVNCGVGCRLWACWECARVAIATIFVQQLLASLFDLVLR